MAKLIWETNSPLARQQSPGATSSVSPQQVCFILFRFCSSMGGGKRKEKKINPNRAAMDLHSALPPLDPQEGRQRVTLIRFTEGGY